MYEYLAETSNIIGENSLQLEGKVGGVGIKNIKSGSTQGVATASADELWKTASHATLPDNVVLIGV